MTTIIGTKEALYSDSQCSDEDQKWSVIKVERIAGALYGAAGDAADGEKFLNWIRRGKRGKKPTVEDGFDCLMLSKDGLFFWDSNLHPIPLLQSHAIGSGAKAARAAMMMGATPEKAIEISCQIDAGSSLPLQVYPLIEPKQESLNA